MKKCFVVGICLAVGLFLLMAQTTNAAEIKVPNGGFELADKNGQPVDWEVGLTNPEKNKIRVDTNVYHSGKASLYFEKGCSPKDYEGTPTPWIGTWMYMGSKEFTLPKPGEYVLSCWVKQGDGPGMVWFTPHRKVSGAANPPWEPLDPNGGFTIICKDKSGDWKLYEKELKIPEGWTTLFIMIHMLEANKGWVDDIKVTPVDEEEE